MSDDDEPPKPRPARPPPVGWVVTKMTCVICARTFTATHPFDAPEVACPDCGHVNRVDQGERR